MGAIAPTLLIVCVPLSGDCRAAFPSVIVFLQDSLAVRVCMRIRPCQFGLAVLGIGASLSLPGQTLPGGQGDGLPLFPASPPPRVVAETVPVQPGVEEVSAVRLLQDFQDADVKFDMLRLMDVLRDRRHEGWVLVAYPDPKTGRPLIGAGFSLDLPARVHPQQDPLNAHPFLEPSSSDLWMASGLAPSRLDTILAQFNERAGRWSKKRFRQNIRTLPPEITDNDATLLLRVAVIQAAYNAKAYCRQFDQLTASQQMALTQLVYQMGVNLGEFSQFLALVNDGAAEGIDPSSLGKNTLVPDRSHWELVQRSLIDSQWARRYRVRAIAVIAMLDPDYAENPGAAERRVAVYLRPARRRGGIRSHPLQQVSTRKRSLKTRPRNQQIPTRPKRRA